MVRTKNLSSCACILVFLSNVILAIQQGIQQPSNAAIQPSTSTGYVQHPGYGSSPYHPHHMPLQYGMQPSPYMMPMMDPDFLDHRMDMAKDMAKQRYAMNMYRHSYSPMGMYPRYPYQQPNQFGPGHHSAPMNIVGGRQGASPVTTHSTQKSKPNSGSKRLSRKKRFVPMMPIPFAPFGGFSPMLGVLRGAAVAGNMAMVHRGRLANMRALAARRNRNGFNQNSRTRESSVSSFNSQPTRPMDNSFNAINNVVARSTGAQPTVVQQLVPQPLSQPVMTQNIISQPVQRVELDPLLSQPALTQNLVLDQPSFIDPMGIGNQQQIIVDNGLGGQQQAIVDGGLATQPQIMIDSGVVGQQPVVIDNTLAGQQQQIADQQAVNQQLAAQAASNKQLDAALQLQMDVQQAINQQTSQQSRLTDQQLTPQNTQQLYSDAGQQMDVLSGQQPQSSQQIYNLQQNQQALDQQAVNQQILNQQAFNQQALDQQTLNQQALIQQALNQPTLNQQVLDQQALNQQALNQQVLNQQAFNQATLDQQTLNQQTLNQQAFNQQALDQQALNQQTLNQQAFNQPALGQQTFNQQTLNQPALNQQTLDQQAMNQQILNQQTLNQQALDQQVLNQQILNGQSLNQQAFDQQAMNQQTMDQHAMKQQILNQQALNQQALDQQVLNQQILNGQALNQQAFNQPILNQQAFDISQSISGQQANSQQTTLTSNAPQSVSNPYEGLNFQIQNVLGDLAASQTSSSQSNAVDVGVPQTLVQLQQPSNQQILVQQPTTQQGALQQSTGQQMSLAYPDLFSFKDPLASNQGNSLQIGQAQAVEPATPGVVAAGGGGRPPGPPPPNPSQTGQQANLAALDLIANLASLNQRGVIPKHHGRPFNL